MAAGVIALGLSACGDDDDSGAADTAGGAAAAAGGKIALLLPETQNARYETKDRPLFEAKVKELCPDCEVLYSNADQDAAKQQQQAEAAITNGAKVLVLDAVNAGCGPVDRDPGRGQGHPGHRLRPPAPRQGRRLLQLVRQRQGRRAAGAGR